MTQARTDVTMKMEMELHRPDLHKLWTAVQRGKELEQNTRDEGQQGRTTKKSYRSAAEAAKALEKARAKRVKEGYFALDEIAAPHPFGLDEASVERDTELRALKLPPRRSLAIRHVAPPQLSYLLERPADRTIDGPGEYRLYLRRGKGATKQLFVGRRHFLEPVTPAITGRSGEFAFDLRPAYPIRPDGEAMLVAHKTKVYEVDLASAEATMVMKVTSLKALQGLLPFVYAPGGKQVLFHRGASLRSHDLASGKEAEVADLQGGAIVDTILLAEAQLAVLQPERLTVFAQSEQGSGRGWERTHAWPFFDGAHLSALHDGRLLIVSAAGGNLPRSTVLIGTKQRRFYEVSHAKNAYRDIFERQGRVWAILPSEEDTVAARQLFNTEARLDLALERNEPLASGTPLASLATGLSRTIGSLQSGSKRKALKQIGAFIETYPDALPRRRDEASFIVWREELRSPLQQAVYLGKSFLVEELLSRDADPNILDREGLCPLSVALVHDHPGVVEGLLAHEPLLNPPPTIQVDGATVVTDPPLVMAAREGRVSWVETLLDRGAELEAVGHGRQDALAAAVAKGLQLGTCTMEPHRYELLELLVARGADLTPPEGALSPLAVEQRDNTLIDRLVALGLDPKGPAAEQALLASLSYNGFEYGYSYPLRARALIRAGFSTPAPLALTLACNMHRINSYDGTHEDRELQREVVLALLAAGADPSGAHDDARRPLVGAVTAPRPDMVVVDALIDAGVEINALDGNRIPAIRYAIGWNETDEVVRKLIGRGADLECTGGPWTALHEAACAGKPDIVELLLENGAELDALTEDGRSALTLANEENRAEVAKLLMDLRARDR
jgi:ankyrin repeat protein